MTAETPAWLLPQPGEVGLHARARKGIEDQHLLALAREAVGQVGADEPGAAGDEHGLAAADGASGRPSRLSSCHQSPRLPARAVPRRRDLTALCRDPFGEFIEAVGEVPLRREAKAARARAMSAKQWRISPVRALPAFRTQVAPAHRRGKRPRHPGPSRSAPLPMLKRARPQLAVSSASRKAWATSSTWTKSRRCAPSSKTIGGWPLCSARRRSPAPRYRGWKAPDRAVDIEQPQRQAPACRRPGRVSASAAPACIS